MDKRVLTAAQLRAMFKNYTFSLAVAGAVIAPSASCENKPSGKAGDGATGKAGDGATDKGANNFVTKEDLKDLANKTDVPCINYDGVNNKITLNGKDIVLSAGFSAGDLTKKEYKLDSNKIVKTDVAAEQKTIVEILKDLMGGSAGVSLDSKEFKIDTAGKLVAKDSTADAGMKDKTVSELIVDMINTKLASKVDSNDARIVVKGVARGEVVGGAPAAATASYAETFTANPTATVGDDGLKTVELGKELIAAKKLVGDNKAAAENKMKQIELNNERDALFFAIANEASTAAEKMAGRAVLDGLKYRGVFAPTVAGMDPTLDTAKAELFAKYNDLRAGDVIFWKHSTTLANSRFVKIVLDVPNGNAGALAAGVDILNSRSGTLGGPTNLGGL